MEILDSQISLPESNKPIFSKLQFRPQIFLSFLFFNEKDFRIRSYTCDSFLCITYFLLKLILLLRSSET